MVKSIFSAVAAAALICSYTSAAGTPDDADGAQTLLRIRKSTRNLEDTTKVIAASRTGKGPDSLCPTAYCGMTIPTGETFKLEQDLVCTEDTAGKSDDSVAITVEEGATLNCGGKSVVQLNDQVGKAVEQGWELAWGGTGVLLKSGAKVENCKVSGWRYGLLIAPPDVDGGYVKEIKIDNCEATLNKVGLFSDSKLYSDSDNSADHIDFSVKNRYVYFLFCMIRLYLSVSSIIITLTHTVPDNNDFRTCMALSFIASLFLQLFQS